MTAPRQSDGNSRNDAGTQVMVGMIGALIHPNPKQALVVGLGTGSSAGWLAAIPSMEKVDAVELEPAILRLARACAPVNHHAMQNPKLHVHLGDAREVMMTSASLRRSVSPSALTSCKRDRCSWRR